MVGSGVANATSASVVVVAPRTHIGRVAVSMHFVQRVITATQEEDLVAASVSAEFLGNVSRVSKGHS